MAILKVHTAQNVEIDYELASPGERLLSGLIDLAVAILYVIFMHILLSNSFGMSPFRKGINFIYFFLVILPVLVYLPAAEYFWQGRTLGKFFLKMKVVREDGTAPSLADYILRWLLRTIDVKLGFLFIFFVPRAPSSEQQLQFMLLVALFMFLPMPVVGLIAMIKSSRHQRVGDLVAGTVVIRKKALYSLDDTILQSTEDDYEPVYKNVLILSDRDINIIKAALSHAQTTRNFHHINRLAEKAREVLKVKPEEPPLQFLQTLMRDYDYLAKKQDAAPRF